MAVLTNTMMQGTSADTGDEDYTVKKSIRFNNDDAPYITRTPYREGDTRHWTFSAWIKRSSVVDSYERIFGSEPTSTVSVLRFVNNIINFHNSAGGDCSTSALFRDPCAWFHVVLTFDSTNPVEADRCKIFINGNKMATSTNNFGENTETNITKELVQEIGRSTHHTGADTKLDAYMSDVYFIDGLSLNPSAFAGWDSANNWNPKKFTMPAPNDGTTWSSGLTSSAGMHSSYPSTKAFNGQVGGDNFAQTTANNKGESNALIWTVPGGGIKVNNSIEIFGRAAASETMHCQVDMGDGYLVEATGASGSWWTAFEGHGTLEKLKCWMSSGNSGENELSGIKIDGKILIDGFEDATTRLNPNDGTKWSDYFFVQTAWYSNAYLPQYGFDGIVGYGTKAYNGTETAHGSYAEFKPPTTITAQHSISLWLKMKNTNGASGEYDVKLNGTSILNDLIAQGGTGDWAWYKLSSKTINTTDGLYIGAEGSNHWCNLRGIEVDGHILIDEAGDNSFHLQFEDTALIGKNSLQTTVGNSNGGLPFYNTSGDQGATKVSGYRADSSAGTTDGTGLIFALPGDVLTDEHNHVNTGSSALTVAATGSAAVSTTKSKFYGSSIKFAGGDDDYLTITAPNAEFEFGTGDFTVEYWVYYDGAPGQYDYIFEGRSGNSQNNTFTISHDYTNSANGSLGMYQGSNTKLIEHTNPPVNKWVHIAFSRASGTLRLFYDGVMVDSGSDSTNISDVPGDCKIGTRHSTEHSFKGFLQDFRIYKGVGKYTQNFTVPSRDDLTSSGFDPVAGTINGTLEWEGGDLNLSNPDGGSGNSGGYKTSYFSLPDNGGTYEWVLHIDTNDNAGWFFDDSTSVTTTHANQQGGNSLGLRNNGSGTAQQSGTFGSSTTNMPSDDMDGDPDWYFTLDRSTNTGTVKAGSSGTSYAYTVPSGTIYFHAQSHGDYNIKLESSATSKTVTSKEVDITLDTPSNSGSGTSATGNYCTWNPLANGGFTLSEGNLKHHWQGSGWRAVEGTFGVESGKWYFEYEITKGPNTPDDHKIGWVLQEGFETHLDENGDAFTNSWYYYNTGKTRHNAQDHNAGYSNWTVGDTIGIALDVDNGKIFFAKNNDWQGSSNPANGTNPAHSISINGPFVPSVTSWANNSSATATAGVANFGQKSFKYTPPSGFKGLCTQSLSDFSSGDSLNNPSKYFDITTYEGTGADLDINGIGFKPDLIWVKERDGNQSHHIQDAIRGATYNLVSNTDNGHSSAANTVKTHNNDGFTTGGDQATNNDGDDFIAYMWDAGSAEVGSPSSSYDITPDKQWINNVCGFSITKYTGNGTNNQSIPHGLTTGYDWLIVKKYEASGNDGTWMVDHIAVDGENNIMILEQPETQRSGGLFEGYIDDPTDNNTFKVVTSGDSRHVNENGIDYIAYAFTSIPGFSKMGIYRGNGSTSGNFIYTGFRPKWLLRKRVKTHSGSDSNENWIMQDRARNPTNQANLTLYPNLNNQEETQYYQVDFISNGFNCRDNSHATNNSSASYLYCAFAENPFKTARAI